MDMVYFLKRILFLIWVIQAVPILAQETYLDNFDAQNYGNNNGTQSFSANWAETNESTSPTTGRIRIDGNRLRFRNLDNRSISRTLDLSGALNATLTLDYERTNGDESIDVQLFDGTSLTTIGTLSGTGSLSYPLVTNQMSSSSEIRFTSGSGNWGGSETIFIDNVLFTVEFPNQPPVLTATGSQTFCEGGTIPIVETISITDTDDTTTTSVYIQISSGYVNGEDLLTLTGTHPNITSSWDPVQGELTLAGPATYTEFETAVAAVEYSSSGVNPTGTRQFSITVGEANYLPATGHYYEYVPDLGITWTDANTAANARTYFGLQGYLATLTSQEEADFSGSQASGVGWIGGSDAATEGVWEWVTGPENGTVFWNGTAGGSTPNFAFWNSGEPNQAGNEDYAHITHPNVNPNGSWNDLSNTGASSGNYQPQGYVVEYGGMPGDPVLNITATTSITIEPTPNITGTTPGSVCGSGTVTLGATASGGTINWYAAATGGSVLSTGTSFTTPVLTSTTTYYAEVVNNGCTSISRTAVLATVHNLPTANAGTDQEICDGESVTLTASASGGTPGYSYLWSTGDTTPSITLAPTGNPNTNINIDYTVTVTDSNGCQDTDTVRVRVESSPTASVSIIDATCGLDNGSITFTFPDHPNRTGIEFSLDNQSSYEPNVADNGGSVSYSGLTSGNYDLWVRWGNNECPVSLGSFTILATPEVVLDTQPADQSVFVNDNAVFTVAASNADTYQWQGSTDGGVNFTNLADGIKYSGTQTATLTVNSTEIQENGYRYRVLVSNSSTSCTALLSNAALLNVRTRTVITNRRITYRVNKN